MLLTISEHFLTRDKNPILINKYANWDYFNLLLENTSERSIPLKAIDHLEVYNFNIAIQDTVWNSTPIIKRKLKGLNYPKENSDMIDEKRKLRRRCHQTRAP